MIAFNLSSGSHSLIVLFFESPGVFSDVFTTLDLAACLHVLHREEHVMLPAHVV